MPEKSEKDNSNTQNNMVNDNMNTYRIKVRLNGYEYPQDDFKCDFSYLSQDYSSAYQRFDS